MTARMISAIAALGLLAASGCNTPRLQPRAPAAAAEAPLTAVDLQPAREQARATGVPLLILIIDSDRGQADRDAADAVKRVAASKPAHGASPIGGVIIDLRISANRAVAAEFHPDPDAWTLITLSPHGVIVDRTLPPRDDAVSTAAARAADLSDAADKSLARLQMAAANHDPAAPMQLADFYFDHQNAAESIPLYQSIAADDSVRVAQRVRAWERAGEAHLWIGEPEKARYWSQRLINELGPKSPEAIAAGNYVRARQDLAAKRYARCRDEITAAVAASPGSDYGEAAASLLKELPAPGKAAP